MLCMLSHQCVQLFATLCTVACQAPLSVGFSRQEYWSGLSCPPPGDLPDPGIKPTSLTSHALAGRFFTKNTSATVLYTACFSYSIFIFFTRWLCSFTHKELEPIFPSPKSALALHLFGAGKCNRSDGVVCQFNPRSQVPSLPLSVHSLGSLSSHYENNHGLPAGWWENTWNQDEQPQQKPFWTKQPPADLVADYRHKLQSPAHTNDQQNHLKIL